MEAIIEAADLIRAFDPDAAAVFRSRPFHRVALAIAFERGFARHSDYTRKVCVLVRKIAERDRLDRAIQNSEG